MIAAADAGILPFAGYQRVQLRDTGWGILGERQDKGLRFRVLGERQDTSDCSCEPAQFMIPICPCDSSGKEVRVESP